MILNKLIKFNKINNFFENILKKSIKFLLCFFLKLFEDSTIIYINMKFYFSININLIFWSIKANSI